jgi:hypothetical protein
MSFRDLLILLCLLAIIGLISVIIVWKIIWLSKGIDWLL